GSLSTELIQGKTVAEAMMLTRRDVLKAIGGLPSRKQHAAALAIETLRSALEAGCSELLPQRLRP
nr:iron-sulfur cluster assembly scaffold protein [Pyrinomonadaceae bacterium]